MGFFPPRGRVTRRPKADIPERSFRDGAMNPLARQFAAFSGVGLVAAVVHYSVLIGLVETGLAEPLPANLSAYLAGGVVSYGLNRRYAFRSDRAHAEATWRFAVVAGVGFLLTGLFTHLLHDRLDAPYVIAALMTTGIVMLWSFAANRAWTFRKA